MKGTAGKLGKYLVLLTVCGSGALWAQQTTPDCSNSLFAGSQYCNPSGNAQAQQQPAASGQSMDSTTTPRRDSTSQQPYVDTAGDRQRRENALRTNDRFPPDPLTDLQRLVRQATGEDLSIFGRSLFQQVPSTFAPADQIPALPDYVVGPGDEILLRIWGHDALNSQLTVDASGSIYIPQVGAVHVAGFRLDQLHDQVKAQLSHTYRNYDFSVNLGHLRSIQVYVVGEARRPGAYTVSSLSTVLNALFASGGPSVNGSLRNIQVRRQDGTVRSFDLYDLALRGDKSQDIRLESNDVIFIPTVGPEVALGGSVRRPAIYEVKPDATLQSVLDLAGGFSPTASPEQIELERIERDRMRRAINITPGSADLVSTLRDGDVLFVGHISPGYEKTVTIRGNLANPGRFAWHPGMRLSEIVPDRRSLLTNDYWRERNQLGLPVPLFEPMNQPGRRLVACRTASGSSSSTNTNFSDPSLTGTRDDNYQDQQPGCDRSGYTYADDLQTQSNGNDNGNGQYLQNGQMSQQSQSSQDNPDDLPPLVTAGGSRVPQDPTQTRNNADQNGQQGNALSRSSLAEQQEAAANIGVSRKPKPVTIKIPVPEIAWSYAVIERLDPEKLRNVLVPFNLGRLVQDHDASQDLELQPGDIVTILSQEDVHVGQDEQTKYIRLEGEFKGYGTYSVAPNETLQDVVRRAGGLTDKAYLFGGDFTRESARVQQQARLDEYIRSLQIDMERSAATLAASSTTAVDPNALVEERSLISQLRQVRSTGRVVLEFRPDSTGLESIPAIPLENGDVFRVPSNPRTVSVIGAVNGQNVFLFDPRRRVQDYLVLAGDPNRIADKKHAFIIRADGSIYSRERAQGVFGNNFNLARVNPGDTVVIPEKLIKPSALRQVIDYSQVFSSFALGAAAINVVR